MHCWPRTLLWLIIALLGTINILSACGQKGPLHHPPEEEPTANQQDNRQ